MDVETPRTNSEVKVAGTTVSLMPLDLLRVCVCLWTTATGWRVCGIAQCSKGRGAFSPGWKCNDFLQWFSKCGSWASVSASPRNVLKMHILISTPDWQNQKLRVGLRNWCLDKPLWQPLVSKWPWGGMKDESAPPTDHHSHLSSHLWSLDSNESQEMEEGASWRKFGGERRDSYSGTGFQRQRERGPYPFLSSALAWAQPSTMEIRD